MFVQHECYRRPATQPRLALITTLFQTTLSQYKMHPVGCCAMLLDELILIFQTHYDPSESGTTRPVTQHNIPENLNIQKSLCLNMGCRPHSEVNAL